MKLTPREHDFLLRVRDGRELRLADRDEDKVRQKMRRLGFAEVLPSPRRWSITEAGRALLAIQENSNER